MKPFARCLACAGAMLLTVGAAWASPPIAAASAPASVASSAPPPTLPQWTRTLTFKSLGDAADTTLLGISNAQWINFSVRSDRVVTAAVLHLRYTPSPSLLPGLSQLRVYLNDTLAGAWPITKDELGQPVSHDVTLDPHLLADFNQLRIEFIGHYTDLCEDPANSTLWLNLAADSSLVLHEEALAQGNDLAWFPSPFFDRGSTQPLVLPMVLAAHPSLVQQQAAALLASYFGTLSKWRGASFPVTFGKLPAAGADGLPPHAVVFATNAHRPPFLADTHTYPAVTGPVVQLLDSPADPYVKLLVLWGRDDADLLVAARALATGGKLMRGARVEIHGVSQLEPRHPYDAPEWIPTDRPVPLSALVQSPQDLESDGLMPHPITVDFKLPPDLFVWRNAGVPLRVTYRYTRPSHDNDSNLSVSVNNRFLISLPLKSRPAGNSQNERLKLDVLPGGSGSGRDKLLVPALTLGGENTLRFKFSYASQVGSAQRGYCQTLLPADLHARIDGDSSIDVSGYRHYMAMPNLAAFAQSAFPFSRMADLSQTLMVVPATPTPAAVTTLLDLAAQMGAEIGYPAFGLQLTDDWQAAVRRNADLLVLGPVPQALRADPRLPLLLDHSRDWLLHAAVRGPAQAPAALDGQAADAAAATRVDLSASAPIAAIVGLESPFHRQRSVVALLATTPADYRLLQKAISDPGQRAAIAGSVAVIRTSGVYSEQVGSTYHIGHLPWWLLLWYDLSGHPLLLALLAIVCVVPLAFLSWRGLRWVARRRLTGRA